MPAASETGLSNLLRFRDDMTRPADGEAETIEKIISAMTSESERTEKKYGHTVRVSHAKATGFLVGQLEVLEGLPPELRQGLFAQQAQYPVLLRVAQGPGELLDDKVSTHRGLAIKVVGVKGPKIAESDEQETQDFVLEAGKTFPNANAASFLQAIRGLALAPRLPHGFKEAVSDTARATNKVLEAAGGESRKLDFFGHRPLHPLAEAYFSQVPMRYGDYVAKIGIFPASAAQERLSETEIDISNAENAFREAVIHYCRSNSAVFEIRVQLATDSEDMPLEDGTVEWPEENSPYRTVARIVIPPQEAYSEARRVYFDTQLGFRPNHSLEAHRPLGSVMRARLQVYPAMARLRHRREHGREHEPRSAGDVPA